MLQFSFCWFWLLIFIIPMDQDVCKDALLWTIVSAIGLLGASAIFLGVNNKDRSIDQDQ